MRTRFSVKNMLGLVKARVSGEPRGVSMLRDGTPLKRVAAPTMPAAYEKVLQVVKHHRLDRQGVEALRFDADHGPFTKHGVDAINAARRELELGAVLRRDSPDTYGIPAAAEEWHRVWGLGNAGHGFLRFATERGWEVVRPWDIVGRLTEGMQAAVLMGPSAGHQALKIFAGTVQRASPSGPVSIRSDDGSGVVRLGGEVAAIALTAETKNALRLA